jgi:hypothetical protein
MSSNGYEVVVSRYQPLLDQYYRIASFKARLADTFLCITRGKVHSHPLEALLLRTDGNEGFEP